jgi:hypothetical protein
MNRILLLWLIVLSVATAGYAQAPIAPPVHTGQPVRTIKTGLVRFSYYEHPDAVAASATFYINGSERTSLYKNFVALTALFANHGKSLTTPAAIQFHLDATTYRAGCKYKDNHQLVIATDDQTLLSTDLSAPPVSPSEARCIELYEFSMPYEQFVQLTNARKVRLDFGGKKLKLTTAQLDALRAMVRGIGQY